MTTTWTRTSAKPIRVFGYDASGRRTALTLPNGVGVSYGYDSASQLTGVTYQNGATLLGNLTYIYDNAGRRVQMGGSFARTGLPQPVTTTSYNAANRLTQWGTATLTYDANGNMTSSGTDGYTWDARNRLVSTLSGASFQYDPFGRRSGKTIGGVTTNFLYDGANVAQELSGPTPTANLLSGGLDEVFVRTDAAGGRNFLADALGSNLALADPAGSLLTQYTYEPFGNTSVSGTSANSFQYTGRENDGTGLYFYRARYYNPALQRFISEDPAEFSGGDVNLYAYVRNDPTSLTDPLGLSPEAGRGSCKKNFGDCLKNNMEFYSLAGIIDLAAGTDLRHNFAAQVVLGNDVTGLASVFVGDDIGSAGDSLASAVSVAAEKGVMGGIGRPLMIGGNSANHLQTLFPRLGRPAQALARTTSLVKAVGIATGYFELKAAIDLGLTGALALNCALQ